ncbi:hypothetical protein C0992_013232 [Termitomyces sp. T32_za158]|nr:hypothetical protein C0992_013232 [Termitomyces sp. T32_za158]
MAAEQAWDIDWVWRKMGKGLRPQVVEALGGGPMVVEGVPMPVSTPHSRPDKGKRKAVLEFEVPKHVCWWLALAPPVFKGGPSGSNVFLPGLGHLLPLIMVHQEVPEILQMEVRRLREEVKGLQEEVRVARQERDKVVQVHNTLLHDHDASLKL